MVRSKVNLVIKAFLTEGGILKSFLNCTAIAKRIKDNKMKESELFSDIKTSETRQREEFIDLVLGVLTEWRNLLGMDHKGKATYFIMMHKAVFKPDEVDLNFESTTPYDIFSPTDKDPLIIDYRKYSQDYENLIEIVSKNPNMSKLYVNIDLSVGNLVQRGTELAKKLKEFDSKIH